MNRIQINLIIASVLIKDNEMIKWEVDKKIVGMNDSQILFNDVRYSKNRKS